MIGGAGKVIAMLIQHGNLPKHGLILLENCKICKNIVDVKCVKVEKSRKRRKRGNT